LTQFRAASIQFPYIHSASGLLPIAVSTALRTSNLHIGNFRVRSAVDTALEIYQQLTAATPAANAGRPANWKMRQCQWPIMPLAGHCR
jgi:hypothetical protein